MVLLQVRIRVRSNRAIDTRNCNFIEVYCKRHREAAPEDTDYDDSETDETPHPVDEVASDATQRTIVPRCASSNDMLNGYGSMRSGAICEPSTLDDALHTIMDKSSIAEQEKEQMATDGWNCQKCTFHNEAQQTRCRMCKGRKRLSIQGLLPLLSPSGKKAC